MSDPSHYEREKAREAARNGSSGPSTSPSNSHDHNNQLWNDYNREKDRLNQK